MTKKKLEKRQRVRIKDTRGKAEEENIEFEDRKRRAVDGWMHPELLKQYFKDAGVYMSNLGY